MRIRQGIPQSAGINGVSSRFLTALAVLAALAFTFPTPPGASAQTPINLTGLDAAGVGNAIAVTVEMDIGGTLPEEWTGWVVRRWTVGDCADPVLQIGNVRPFPTGSHSYQMTDFQVTTDRTYRYTLSAVDADGGYHGISYEFGLPGFVNTDFASMSGNGIIAEGTMTSDGYNGVQIDFCEERCWAYFWVPFYPEPDLRILVDTGVTVRLYGTLDIDFEGPYITSITDWTFLPDCGPVATDGTTWDGLKAMYR